MIIIKYLQMIDFEYDIQGIVRSFYPGIDMATNSDEEAELYIIADFSEDQMVLSLAEKSINHIVNTKKFSRCQEVNPELSRKETKNVLKRELYNLLHEYTGKELLWGTLSGIRPTKITSALLEEGMEEEKVIQYMKDVYYVSDLKARESLEISKNERRVLKNIDYKNGYSLYIGIPFCPSTCLYCSFTSYPLKRYQNKVDQYIQALCKEIRYCAKAFAHKKLCTVYIGGGTPTTLEPNQLEVLLSCVEEAFNLDHLLEFTVEAGRPDSITREKLKVLKKHAVTRISINPQTMKQKTLEIIGRHHTVDDFIRAYAMAREEGFDNINMDFILGLPDESKTDVEASMDKVLEMKPDSLTIHSLAIKRAARLNIFKEKYENYLMFNSEEIMDVTKKAAKELNLSPYYLYRQKNMAGNLENIGYAKEGKEGIYNILIMEEKQPILAVGAGASTKMVFPDGHRIERIENVKDVDIYIDKIDEMIARKSDFITENSCFSSN